MKTNHIISGLIVLGLLAIAAVSFAGPMHGSGGMGNGMMGKGMMAECPQGMGQGMGMGMGNGHGPGMMGNGNRMGGAFWASLTPEQQTKYSTLQDAYAKKTEGLRTDMWAKHTELQALSGNDKVEPKYITQLVQDMKEIATKLRAEHATFTAQVEKELGIKNYGRGLGDCPFAGDAAPAAPTAPAN